MHRAPQRADDECEWKRGVGSSPRTAGAGRQGGLDLTRGGLLMEAVAAAGALPRKAHAAVYGWARSPEAAPEALHWDIRPEGGAARPEANRLPDTVRVPWTPLTRPAILRR